MVSHSARAMRQATKIAAQQPAGVEIKSTPPTPRQAAVRAYERSRIEPVSRDGMDEVGRMIDNAVRSAYVMGYITAKQEEEERE